MNTRLAQFLLDLVRDPARLSAFNDPERREQIVGAADLPEEDKNALRSQDANDVLRQLSVGDEDEVQWVIAPGIKRYTVGFTLGIKALPRALGIKAPRKSRSLNVAGKGSAPGAPRGGAKPASRGSQARATAAGKKPGGRGGSGRGRSGR
jgi:hypothetical protein